MAIRQELTGGARTQFDMVTRCRPIRLRRERLATANHTAYRPPQPSCGVGYKGAARCARSLGAEPASHVGTDDPYLFDVHFQLVGNLLPEPIDRLGGLIDSQSIVAPYRGGRKQLDRVVRLLWRLVIRFDLHCGGLERLVEIPN